MKRFLELDPRLLQFGNDLLQACTAGRFVCIYPHVAADGDALGSAVALGLAMQKLGAEVAILPEEEVPGKFDVLPRAGLNLICPPGEKQENLAQKQELGLVVDCPGGGRLGKRERLFDQAPLQRVLDHHIPDEERPSCKGVAPCVAYCDRQAAATCELAGLLILHWEESSQREILDQEIATALMLGLVTDTGRFTFPNTRPQTLALAAQLLAQGAPLNRLSYLMYDLKTRARFALLGYVGEETDFAFEGRFAFCLIPQEVLRRFGAQDTDLDGLAGEMRSVAGVKLAVLLREVEPGTFKASVRSTAPYSAQALARALGGGGHLRASGFTLTETEASTLKMAVYEAAEAELRRAETEGEA